MRAVLAAALAAAALVAPTSAHAFDVRSVGLSVTDRPVADPNDPSTTVPGPVQLAAGAHPDVLFAVQYPIDESKDAQRTLGGGVRNVDADLPRGLIVDPTVAPQCTIAQITDAQCPPATQVGLAGVGFDGGFVVKLPLYNITPPPGVPGRVGFNVQGVPIYLDASVRTGSDYGISARVRDITQAVRIEETQIELWGVPADPIHDSRRSGYVGDGPVSGVGAGIPQRAFVSNPSRCDAGPLRFSASANAWVDTATGPAKSTSVQYGTDTPLTITGCDEQRFDPSVTVRPTTSVPDSPTGLDVAVSVPQSDSPDRRATPNLKDLSLLLPEGMNVNPSAADGRSSCSPAQVALTSAAAATCPDAASLGTVEIDTPLLDAPLRGKAYLASQGDNPFGTTLAMYLVASGSGVVIKLPGRIDADPSTGRLRVTFTDNPELPFSQLRVRLDDGPRAPLTTPPTCGPKTAEASVTAWSGQSEALTDGFSIDCVAGLGDFAPGFSAGAASSQAGSFSPFSLSVARPDGQAALQDVRVDLPPGLLAKLAGVPLCADPAAGACDAASRVGGAAITAGAGSKPFPLAGDVFLTGPYKGAPYGLATRVRAIAGPLDLGTVVVRQALFIDPETTAVTAVSDPLPTILAGIPIRLRTLDFALDQPGFTVNPTSCAAGRAVSGVLGALGGASAAVRAGFQVNGCDRLPLTPKLSLALRGKGRTLRDGGHPGITARLTQPAAQSGLKRVEVKLPLSLALDPENAQALCEADAAAGKTPSCPVKSAIGTASVRSPLLPDALKGPVYFVKGVRTTASGRQVRTLPKLVLPLKGNGLQINVRANTAVRDGKLVAQFDGIPDAPISRFDLSLNGGKNGVLVATKSVCKATNTTGLRFRGHSGKLTTGSIRLGRSCK